MPNAFLRAQLPKFALFALITFAAGGAASAAQPAVPPKRPTPRAAVQVYLTAMRPIAFTLRQEMRDGVDDLKVFTDDPLNEQGEWAAGAVELRVTATELAKIANRARPVRAPTLLRPVHPSFRAGILAAVSGMRELADGMESANTSGAIPAAQAERDLLSQFQSAIDDANADFKEWRDETIIVCRRLLILVPLWMKQVGPY
jgi:hypothetical protein